MCEVALHLVVVLRFGGSDGLCVGMDIEGVRVVCMLRVQIVYMHECLFAC